MPHSLITFHFSALKAGQIIKQFCVVRGVSKASLAAKTGVSYDTVDNFFQGKVKEVQFERIFKYCVVLGIPIELFMLQLLEGEDIDFADDVLLFNPTEDASSAAELSSDAVSDAVPDTVSAVASAVTQAAKSVPDMHAEYVPSYPVQGDLPDVLARTERHYADRLADMVEARRLLIEQHDKEVAVLCQQLDRQDQLIRALLPIGTLKGGFSL